MRILVTGATGFLGGATVARLAASGHEPVALGRDPARLAALTARGVPVVEADLATPPPDLAARTGPIDAVVHCAGLSSPWGRLADFRAANVTGTETMLALAEATGARRIVNISSPSVTLTLADREGVREDEPLPPPINAYAATKAEAERLVQARAEFAPISLRPRGIYGSGDTALLPRLAAAARRGPLPLLRGGVAAIDLTHVSDVVSAIEASLRPEAPVGTYHISSGEQLPVRQIVEAVCARLGIEPRWRRLPLGPTMAAARLVAALSRNEPRVTPYALALFAYRQSLDISRARSRLDWAPKVTFARGLALTFDGAAR